MFEIMKTDFGGIYSMKRGIIEVGFDDQLNLSSFSFESQRKMSK